MRGGSRLRGLCSGLSGSRLGRCVLAGALGLQDIGVEDAVAAIGAHGQGLGVVFEGVRRRLGALVVDREHTAGGGLGRVALKLIQNKRHVRAALLDGAGYNEALHAQLAVVGLVAHGAQFGDGNVVAFASADAGHGQPDNGAHDNGHRDSDTPSLRELRE